MELTMLSRCYDCCKVATWLLQGCYGNVACQQPCYKLVTRLWQPL